MKKRRRKRVKTIFYLLLLFCALAVFQNYFQQRNNLQFFKSNSFTDVIKYQPLIENELGKYHLEKYTPVLIALMQQESHGQGGDPMQASESAGLPRNSITDPKQSIYAGVKHFQRALSYGNQKKVDFPTIIQAYNMGTGYIDYVAQHGGKHSEELAKEFSLLQVKKKPTLYTCGDNKLNFRYPYCYGDYTYATKVTNNLKLLSGSSSATAAAQ